MNWIISILIGIALLYLWHLMNKKIDRNGKNSLTKEGTAVFLRKNFTPLIDGLLQHYQYKILKERSDSIIIGKESLGGIEKIAIQQSYPNILVNRIVDEQIKKEWKFSQKMSAEEMLSTIQKD